MKSPKINMPPLEAGWEPKEDDKNAARELHVELLTRITTVVPNQIVRPFTAKWHKLSMAVAFDDPTQCKTFRQQLTDLQTQLTRCTQMLGAIARFDEWTKLEADDYHTRAAYRTNHGTDL
jgi:hypothetical protein